MPDRVSGFAFPDYLGLGFNIELDLGHTGDSSSLTVAADPIEDAIVIRDEEPRGRCARMPFVQIPFVADGKLDVLFDQIDTVSQLNHLGIGRARKARINFNDDWAMIRPSDFNVRWSPAKAESSQTAQRNIGDTLMLVAS